MWTEYFFDLFLYMPIVVLTLILLFGINLGGKYDVTMRVASGVLLIAGLSFAYYSVCCAGEQGAVGILFIGLPTMGTLLILYFVLKLIQFLRKA